MDLDRIVRLLAAGLCVLGTVALAPSAGAAQTASTAPVPDPALTGLDHTVLDDLVAANRILADQGVLDAFGHISVRDPRNPKHYLMSHSKAPAIVTADDIIVNDLDSIPVTKGEETRGLYLERSIHGEIYKVRPDVNAVVHSHSPTVVPFSVSKVPFRPIPHNAAFLGSDTPTFEISDQFGPDTDLMITNAARGKALAAALGSHSVILLRGHGDVAVGATVQIAVWNAYYTEVNARMESVALALGQHPRYLSPGEIKTDAEEAARYADRPWEYWKRKAFADDRGQ